VKTRITNIAEGVDFLGHDGKLLGRCCSLSKLQAVTDGLGCPLLLLLTDALVNNFKSARACRQSVIYERWAPRIDR
jgi:hypothetical protein